MSILGFAENPYLKYYYESIADKAEEIDPEVDDESLYVVKNEKRIQQYLDGELKRIKSTRHEWLYKASREDPAFMLDPINDYYKKMIPVQVQELLSDEEMSEVLALVDPVTWAEKYLLQRHKGWKSRMSKDGIPYQAMIIRSLSKRMVTRAGRRIGKSLAMAVKLCHKMFTWKNDGTKTGLNIVIFTPNQAQLNVIFKMIEMLIDNNPILMEMIPDGKIPSRRNPQIELCLTNGVTVKGFVSGSTAIRGSAADILWMDEASFLTSEDIDSVIALMAENNDVEVWLTSTPKGLRDWFYERVYDKAYTSFYFPSDKFHPMWGPKMEEEFRANLTESGFKFEVLAEFASDGEGVFQNPFIDASITNYHMNALRRIEGNIYSMGVDWNSPKNGTQIRVVEYDPINYKYRCVDTASVSVDGWTQTIAVAKIKEMNRKWNCSHIYVDNGFNGMQLEAIHEIGHKALYGTPDKNLINAKAIDFGSTIETNDIYTHKKMKKAMKPFIVNNAVRVFESGFIEISKFDEILINQLRGYYIDRITPNGTTVYGADSKFGDHALDALMLALLVFILEYSHVGKRRSISAMAHVNPNVETPVDYNAIVSAEKELYRRVENDKISEYNKVLSSGGSTTGAVPKPFINTNSRSSSVTFAGSSRNNSRTSSFSSSRTRGF